MGSMPEREQNQAAFRRLKPLIDQTYPQGRFLAIHGGAIVADAASFDALTTLLRARGQDPKESLVVQAGVDYPETAVILAQGIVP
jgi:hypothetical protein